MLIGRVGDLLGALLAHGRQPVGQEDHDAEGAVGRRLAERFLERAGDVGAAFGFEPAHPRFRVPPAVRPIAAHAVRERHQAEPVSGAQRAENLDQRGLRLRDLLTGHRAGDVEHRHYVAMQRRGVRRRARCEQQHEIPVLAGGPVRHQRHPDGARGQRQVQLHVAGGR